MSCMSAAFQAEYEGSIPFTRSNTRELRDVDATTGNHNSAGQRGANALNFG
jgi:hypothetical protein